MIVYFDGVCGLCNGAVDFLLARDKHERLQFAPLQGTHARTNLPPEDIETLSSLVVTDGVYVYRKSDAVLIAGKQLGGVWSLLASAARLVPRSVRNIVYDIVAKNRYTVFGKRETCRLPTSDERRRFLA